MVDEHFEKFKKYFNRNLWDYLVMIQGKWIFDPCKFESEVGEILSFERDIRKFRLLIDLTNTFYL